MKKGNFIAVGLSMMVIAMNAQNILGYLWGDIIKETGNGLISGTCLSLTVILGKKPSELSESLPDTDIGSLIAGSLLGTLTATQMVDKEGNLEFFSPEKNMTQKTVYTLSCLATIATWMYIIYKPND